MKKLTLIVLTVIMVSLLSGCSAKEAIASDKQEYIVSSLGFDNEGGKIKMLIEAIVVNTDDLSEDKESRMITGVGINTDEAYSEITSKITQPLSLGHNAITVIGNKITEKQLQNIFEFCENEPQINIATMLIFTRNAEKLLSSEPISSVAVGYDVMSMIEVAEEKMGTIFKNRLYEVRALNNKPMKTFWVPNITAEDEKMILSGLAVFQNNRVTKILNNQEAVVLSFITDSLTRGETVIEGEKIKTDYCKVAYDFSFEEKLNITVNVNIKAKGDTELLKSKAEEMLRNEDIFGLGNVIYQKKPKLWEKIKENYTEYYENAERRVIFK